MKVFLEIFAALTYRGFRFFVTAPFRAVVVLLASTYVFSSVSSRFVSVFSSHFPLQKLPGWHHKAGMESRGNPLNVKNFSKIQGKRGGRGPLAPPLNPPMELIQLLALLNYFYVKRGSPAKTMLSILFYTG